MARTFRYKQIASALRSAIADGEYAAGSVLQSESELSEAYDASRVTIRKALEELRSEGLVDSRQGFGWYVGADSVRQSLDALETIEAQLAEAGRVSARSVLRFGFVEPPADVRRLLGASVLEVVRLHLADDEPFALVTVWCEHSIGADFSRTEVESSSFVDLLGAKLGQVTQVIGAIAAGADVAKRLLVAAGTPLLRVRRVTIDVDGSPALVSEHLYPAHRTEFEVTLGGASSGPAGLRLVQ